MASTQALKSAAGDSLRISVKQSILDLGKARERRRAGDHEIVETLGEHGIPIARRTVAKYRDEMNILPSHMRRKY